MAVETQTYLDETKTPSLKTLVQARNELKAYVPDVGIFQEQLTKWARMAEEALITETEEGMKEFMLNQLAFQHDLVERINQLRVIQRRMIDVGTELNQLDADMRQHIIDEGLGYTT
jgi:hypothetical protein